MVLCGRVWVHRVCGRERQWEWVTCVTRETMRMCQNENPASNGNDPSLTSQVRSKTIRTYATPLEDIKRKPRTNRTKPWRFSVKTDGPRTSLSRHGGMSTNQNSSFSSMALSFEDLRILSRDCLGVLIEYNTAMNGPSLNAKRKRHNHDGHQVKEMHPIQSNPIKPDFEHVSFWNTGCHGHDKSRTRNALKCLPNTLVISNWTRWKQKKTHQHLAWSRSEWRVSPWGSNFATAWWCNTIYLLKA